MSERQPLWSDKSKHNIDGVQMDTRNSYPKHQYDSFTRSRDCGSIDEGDTETIFTPPRPQKSNQQSLRSQSKTSQRMIDREGDFFQSEGRISIRKKIKKANWRNLYAGDWFHSLVDAPTWRILIIVIGSYLLLINLFAILYFQISRTFDCSMDIKNYQEALAFAIETMATIGYGTKDIFFGDCWLPIVVLTSQICVKLLADGTIIGIIYSRLSRPNSRASTIIFSNHAIIRRIRGKLYFMFQLCELRKHQLVEAHVRLYLIRNESNPYESQDSSRQQYNSEDCIGEFDLDDDTLHGNSQSSVNHLHNDNDHTNSFFQTCSMRLNHPNDELGSMLLLCLPQLVVHEIDAFSPLMPPPVWRSCATGQLHRWDPPVYKQATTACNPSASECLSDKKGSVTALEPVQSPMRYDPDLLSSMTFPSVNRRANWGDTAMVTDDTATVALQETLAAMTTPSRGSSSNAAAVTPLSPVPSSPLPFLSPGLKQFMTINVNPENPVPLLTPSRLPFHEMDQNTKFSLPGSAGQGCSRSSKHTSSSDVHTGDIELPWQQQEREMIQQFMSDRNVEVVAILEGTEQTTGGAVQAKHSFIFNEVLWHKTFCPCVFKDSRDGSAVVDFEVFHNTMTVPKDAAYAGSISSIN